MLIAVSENNRPMRLSKGVQSGSNIVFVFFRDYSHHIKKMCRAIWMYR